MKIYLAGMYARRLELSGHAGVLRGMGHAIVCRWLDGGDGEDDRDPPHHLARQYAEDDFSDVDAADALVLFGEPAGESVPGASRGGRFAELGYALAKGKRVYVVGHRENIFCHHPDVWFVESFAMLRLFLAGGPGDGGAA